MGFLSFYLLPKQPIQLRCSVSPIIGTRFKCKVCDDFDFCEQCFSTKQHPHQLIPIYQPVPNLVPPPSNKVIHQYVKCDGCGQCPMIGNRYKCQQCPDFDFCQKCYQICAHDPTHIFLPIIQPQVLKMSPPSFWMPLVKSKIQELKFGLYLTNNLFQDNMNYSIPLKHISFATDITNNIVKTIIKQKYVNNSNYYIEAEYLFPIWSGACFDSFEATLQNQTIKGIIKEKQQAKEEYQSHLEKGNTVAYSEINEESEDVMKVKIGNIPPNSEIEIHYSYLQELETQLNKFWRFTLPSTLTPRYQSHSTQMNEDLLDLGNIQTMPSTSPQAYTWSIVVTLLQTTKIVSLDSPSHKLLILQKNQEETYIELMVENEQSKLLPNKDFVLIFRNDSIRQPQVMLGQGQNSQMCAMISFVPDFSNCQLDDALKQSLGQSKQDDPNDFPINFDAARSEYIFLIDRSGSMSGQRIDHAKEALILFLKSMPTNTYFNIYSFGSQFSQMFPKSVPYKTQQVQQAIEQVKSFSADFGGTEIYRPLETILEKNVRIKGFPRQVFLLTDGDVSNPNQVISLIKQNNKFNRVHSIGIGSGASNYLIKQCAKQGKGNSVFVSNNNDISGSIIKLLRYSLTPCLDNFVFSYDQNIIESVIPAPHNIPCILKNQPFILYMFFKTGITERIQTQVVLTCSDSAMNENLTFIVEIDQNNCLQIENAYKLGIFKMIQCLEEKLVSSNQNLEDDIFLSKKINIKEEIVDLSVKHQILSKQTAFLCVVKEIADENAHQVLNQSIKEKIIIPSLISADYETKPQIQNQFALFSSNLPVMCCRQTQSALSGGLFGSARRCENQFYQPESQISQPQSIPKCIPQPKQFDQLCVDEFDIQKQSYQPPSAPSLPQLFPQPNIQMQQQTNLVPQPPQMNSLFDNFQVCNENSNIMMQQQQRQQIQQQQQQINYQHTFSFGEEPQSQQQQQIKPTSISMRAMNQTEIFKLIVNSFQLEGYWRYDMGLLSQIIQNTNEFNSTLPMQIGQVNIADYWITIIVLSWLQTKSIANKNEWILIAQKAENWLDKFGSVWKSHLPKAQSLLK